MLSGTIGAMALGGLAHAYLSSQGNETVGVGRQLSPSALGTSHLGNLVSIDGYNISGSATPIQPEIAGWKMGLSIALDVPDNTGFQDISTLSMTAPDDVTLDNTTWRLCAVVFPGVQGESNSYPSDAVNGSCSGILKDECLYQLDQSPEYFMFANGSCGNFTLPLECGDQLGNNEESYMSFSLDFVGPIQNSSFYSFSISQAQANNQTAAEEAGNNTWPVFLDWGTINENGNTTSRRITSQCLQAKVLDGTNGTNGTTGSNGMSGSSSSNRANRSQSNKGLWAFMIIPAVIALGLVA